MKYLVKTPIRHDGEEFEPGETIELSKAQAAAMPHAVEPVVEKVAEKNGDKEGDKK